MCTENEAKTKSAQMIDELHGYLNRRPGMLPNYADRHCAGEPISSASAELTVKSVIAKRMVKRQQLPWSPTGAHLMLQIRCRVLDGTPDNDITQWHQPPPDDQRLLFKPKQRDPPICDGLPEHLRAGESSAGSIWVNSPAARFVRSRIPKEAMRNVLAEDLRSNGFRCVTSNPGSYVRVEVEGDAYRRMTQALRHDLGVHASLERQRCVRVAQVV
jgi:hypothetical protein